MKARIYYFSGTGNSLRAAEKIAEHIGGAELISMRCNPEEVSAEDCDVIGFTFPPYHWTMPAPAVRFVEGLKINPNAYIFAVSTPGLICGYAFERVAELIKAKGAELDYGAKVYSVASYAVVYPPFPSPKLVVPRTERRLDKIGGEIAKRMHRDYPRAGAFVRARRDKVMVPYIELQKYADRPFIVYDSCISCGLCTRVCPCGNMELREGKPVFLGHCAQCMACVVNCPKRAIGYEIKEGDMELLKASSKKTPIAKLMKLPPKRKLYRNPYVSSADMTKDKIIIGQGGRNEE